MRTTRILHAAILPIWLLATSCSAQAPADTPKLPPGLKAAGLRTFYKGRADARRDLAHNHLVIQASAGFGSPSVVYQKLLRDRYKIDIEIISTDEISDEQYGYKTDYNSISMPEIERRYGKNVLNRAYAESEKKASAH